MISVAAQKHDSGTDSFPVAPEAVLTRTHCIKGRPLMQACPATLTSFLPSLLSPLKNN